MGDDARTMKPVPRSILFGVGFISFGTLLFEVSLTRIFFVTLWYYFGFLVISLAMTGLAVAAVWCFLNPTRCDGPQLTVDLVWFALGFAIAAPLAVCMHLKWNFLNTALASGRFYWVFSMHLLLLFIPFFTASMCISMVLLRYRQHLGAVYAWDLIGAAGGSVAVVPLLYRFSPMAVVFLVSAVACLAGGCFANQTNNRRVQAGFGLLVVLSLWLFGMNDRWGLLKVVAVKNLGTSNFQTEEGRKIFERWSPMSRVTVLAPEKRFGREVMRISTDVYAYAPMCRFDGNFSTWDGGELRQSDAIVHHLKQHADVLILGSGGGRNILTALGVNQKSIAAVEINPVTIELVTKRYADYIGHIFNDPRVTLHLQEGRSFVAESTERYDVIQMTVVDGWGSMSAGGYIFNENGLYTKEAIDDYTAHLKPNGFLSITRSYDGDEGPRLINLILQSMEAHGVKDIHERLAVVQGGVKERVTALLKNGRLNPDETTLILDAAREGKYHVVYAPGIPQGILEQSERAALLRSLIHPSAYGSRSRTELVRSYPRNITASTDDKPFFFFMTPFRNSFQLDQKERESSRLAIPILYGAFGFFCLFSFFTISVPLYLSQKADIRGVPCRRRLLLYCAALGVGYMLIEVSWMSRLVLFLGYPTDALVVVLATLLLSSGMGSWVAGAWKPEGNPRRLVIILGGIFVLGLAEGLLLYDQFSRLMWLGKPIRILLAVSTIAPLGFLMGMCLPMGLQLARGFHDHLVPWGWGVNGAFSTFASILALILALNLGLKATLFSGVMCYGVALVVLLNVRLTNEPMGQVSQKIASDTAAA